MKIILKSSRAKRLLSAGVVLFASLFSVFAETGDQNAISSVAALTEALREDRNGMPFDITATIIQPYTKNMYRCAVQDATGAIMIEMSETSPENRLSKGDHVHIRGSTKAGFRGHSCYAIAKTADVLSQAPIPPPVEVDAADLAKGLFDNKLVRFKGTVVDAFLDDIDPLWGFLILRSGRESIYACFASSQSTHDDMNDLIGAEIAITGFYSELITEPRFHSGRFILISGRDAVSVIRPAPADPFDVPALTAKQHDSAAVINSMARRRMTGRVIAVWHGDRLLLRTAEGNLARVDLAERRPPSYGMCIEAAGKPETDLYRLNLSRAIWRTNSVAVAAEPPPVDVTARQLLNDGGGRPAVQIRYHGKAVRLKGVVRSLPSPEYSDGRLSLDCDRYIIPIDVSACPQALAGVEIGCVIEVAGICLFEMENWRPNEPFPRVDDFAVVVRTPDDVRILSRPPWLTTGRLLSVIGTLLAALAGVFVWNRQLNRVAERRGRELTEETVARVTADLKVGERTRLAIELHDALSRRASQLPLGPPQRRAGREDDGFGDTQDTCAVHRWYGTRRALQRSARTAFRRHRPCAPSDDSRTGSERHPARTCEYGQDRRKPRSGATSFFRTGQWMRIRSRRPPRHHARTLRLARHQGAGHAVRRQDRDRERSGQRHESDHFNPNNPSPINHHSPP